MPRRRPVRPDLDQAAVARLSHLYGQLPVLDCLRLCGSSCAAHVDASALELARAAADGVDLRTPTPDRACPALGRTALGIHTCRVHPVRPMVCRLWGIAASMPCPHGCAPAGGPVADGQVLRWMLTSLEIGGNPDPALRQLLERCLNHPVSTALLAQLLRGDHAAAPELRSHLASHSDGNGHSTDTQ